MSKKLTKNKKKILVYLEKKYQELEICSIGFMEMYLPNYLTIESIKNYVRDLIELNYIEQIDNPYFNGKAYTITKKNKKKRESLISNEEKEDLLWEMTL